MRVNHHKFDIKADQMPCRKARRYSKRYISSGHKPRHFSCQKYDKSETQLAFRCTHGIKVFYAIRR